MSVRTAGIQLCSTDDVDANLATCRALVAEAAASGAKLCILPECFAFLGRREEQKLAIAEVIDGAAPGPILAATMAMAREHGVWLIGGGMPERPSTPRPASQGASPGTSGAVEAEQEKVFNAAVVIDAGGRLVATYRKIHLFDVDIPGGAQLRESDSTLGGAEPLVVDTPWARIGVTICYDLRFPELYRALAAQGAEVVVVPSAFTAHTGAAHWHVLLRARAIENQVYVVAPAQAGRHNDRRQSYGHSLIIDPWGTVLADLASGPGVAAADLDRELLQKTRTQMPCLQHRRL
jgi:nitrilase